jgi:hypothetical protein
MKLREHPLMIVEVFITGLLFGFGPRGDMAAVALRESFVQMRSATKMRMLFLNLFATATQRNDLTVLPHSSNRCSAALLRGSPIGGNIVGVGNPEELSSSIDPTAQAVPFVPQLNTH